MTRVHTTHDPRPLDAIKVEDDSHMPVETKGRGSALGWGIYGREPVNMRDGCTVEQDNHTAS